MFLVKLLNQLCTLKIQSLETEKIQKYHIYDTLERGMMTMIDELIKRIKKSNSREAEVLILQV